MSMFGWYAGHDCNVGDFPTIETIQVIGTATSSADAILHGDKLDVVSRFAGTQGL